MNSYGGKTSISCQKPCFMFESSVNSYGGKTKIVVDKNIDEFESSVNSYGGKTIFRTFGIANSLRVV